ncbi:NAD-dependent deacetylase sirtuin-2 [Trichodelitschia bisporula]|uniref:NAD-dependent protein deacetylase n=1 Tax=Trichodelitschia bisporula TaxID=703511 RepID=A0A6G1I1K5_9PEZI|nr:NAD-dependent deacetylase sirtuin-2 [Trichodelitschia bisporula]
MGQSNSTPSRVLEKRTVEGIAKYIQSGKVNHIVVMTGAGISTSAGIPDFRSPETGLYANLARLELPYPEAVFEIEFFRQNPLPFYTLAHELYPGKFRPTITHTFLSLLDKKGLLLKLFTQNIDCLEREAGVPGDRIVEAHGSFATQRCIECQTEFPREEMEDLVLNHKGEVPRCKVESCGGLVKPDIVFFGEQLPPNFFSNIHMVGMADLVIVMGSSLSVMPFSMMPEQVAEGVPRLLINREEAGGLGSRPDDVVHLSDCDSGVRKLAEALGWLEELEAEWAATSARYPAEAQSEESTQGKSKEEILQEEVLKITREVDETLKASKAHITREQATTEQEPRAVEDTAGLADAKAKEEPLRRLKPLRTQRLPPQSKRLRRLPPLRKQRLPPRLKLLPK